MVLNFIFCPDPSQFDEEDWSNDCKDYTNKEKLTDAAQILPEKEIVNERMIKPKDFRHIITC